MNIMFFHNKHDKQSREMLKTLPSDAIIIDFYSGDRIPENYPVGQFPYLVDKELVLVTPEPFYVPDPVTKTVYDENGEPLLDESGNIVTEQVPGTLTLEWECRDKDGNLVTDAEPHLFFKVDDGKVYDEIGQGGIYSIDFVIGEPVEFDLLIFDGSYGFHPWKGTIKVVAKSG